MRTLKQKDKKKSYVPTKLKVMMTGVLLGIVAIAVFVQFPIGKKCLDNTRAGIFEIISRTNLRLEQVSVEGHVHTSLKEINSVLNLTQNMDILDVDLTASRKKILTLPWVKSAVIERHLPDTLYIRLIEKTPIAWWQHDKKYDLLDESGAVISDKEAQISGLLLVVGEDAPVHTPDLIARLAKYPDIAARVQSAVRIGKRRWNLVLDETGYGVILYLPDEDIEQALERFQTLNQNNRVLKKDLKIIDLRFPDRLIIRSNADELMQQSVLRRGVKR